MNVSRQVVLFLFLNKTILCYNLSMSLKTEENMLLLHAVDDKAGKPSILIVDDDDEILISFKIWLDSEGFRSLTASNSTEALKITREEELEVVLLDYRLGTENGLTVANSLREVDKNLKVIIITCYPYYKTAVESIKSGIFDYVSKEEPNEKILKTIQKALQTRKKELLENKKKHAKAPLLEFIVICKHSLIKEHLENFSLNYTDFKLMKTFGSLELLKETEFVPEVDIAMVCATCCLETFDESFYFFNELYKVLPTVRPVLFNENFSDNEKVDLIKIGIKGFFSIDIDSKKLERALSLIKKGEIWTNRRLTSLALPNGPEYLKNYLDRKEAYSLSSREIDILRAMVFGLKNKEIAEKLFISENTVKTHINNIFKKFGVNNRAQAIRFALERKIL
jgi:DNA-binding NarL/FixJ family response regulator